MVFSLLGNEFVKAPFEKIEEHRVGIVDGDLVAGHAGLAFHAVAAAAERRRRAHIFLLGVGLRADPETGGREVRSVALQKFDETPDAARDAAGKSSAAAF